MPGSSSTTHSFPQENESSSQTHLSPEPASGADNKDQPMSRKRERELSLDPSTPRPFADEEEKQPTGKPKEGPGSPKKTRTSLEATVEEEYVLVGPKDTRPDSPEQGSSKVNSPPFSPRLENKVRQISQGVGDMDVKRGQSFSGNGLVTPERQSLDLPPDGEPDKNLKRKLDDRALSVGPSDSPIKPPEPAKRTKEAAPTPSPSTSKTTKDIKMTTPPATPTSTKPSGFLAYSTIQSPFSPANDSKRPTDETRSAKQPSPPQPALGGFMAYAATKSPFASVKGENVFQRSPNPSPSPFVGTITALQGPALITPKSAQTTTTSSTPEPSDALPLKKTTGLEAFQSPGLSSPFAALGKGKNSLITSSAFSAYALGGAQGFGNSAKPSTPKSAEDSDEGENSEEKVEASTSEPAASFGDILRSKGKEEEEKLVEENKLNLTEQELTTGEEDDETIHQVRGKLYVLSAQNQWQERGTGLLKLNVRRSDGGGARLVMRKEAVYSLLLNIKLFQGMSCTLAQDPRYVRFSAFESGTAVHYNLRVANQKIAEELVDEISSMIPASAEHS